MKLISLITGLLLCFAHNINAQKTYRLDATPANAYGINYSLPLSALEITIDYEIITSKEGPYNLFAERYLNLKDVPSESSIEYKLLNIRAKTIGIPDESNKYFVEFKANTVASFVTLTQDGLLCAINDDYSFMEDSKILDSVLYESPLITDGNRFLTQEILMASTTAKQAELIAKQIYNLRANRNDILSGEIDNIPTDGQAFRSFMNRIDEQEEALTILFKGEKKIVKTSKTFIIDINGRNIENKVIARFSKKLGPVNIDNLAGAPIYLNLKALTSEDPASQDPKMMEALEKKLSKGIVYNIPNKANIEVSYENKMFVKKEVDVVQFGTKDVLDQKVFGSKSGSLKVIFYPDLGAIKSTSIIP